MNIQDYSKKYPSHQYKSTEGDTPHFGIKNVHNHFNHNTMDQKSDHDTQSIMNTIQNNPMTALAIATSMVGSVFLFKKSRNKNLQKVQKDPIVDFIRIASMGISAFIISGTFLNKLSNKS